MEAEEVVEEEVAEELQWTIRNCMKHSVLRKTLMRVKLERHTKS